MLQNMQLDTIRQFQIQRGTLENILDENTKTGEGQISDKYFNADLKHLQQMEDSSSEESEGGPGVVYL